MCGIVGRVAASPVEDRSGLCDARETLRHRGPDDAGVWWSADGLVGLAHRRLAIIDLSPAGHQPMADHAGELVVVFNGEIYNYLDLRHELAAKGHRFDTASDTEVLLAAYREWGVECLDRLNGMFAFGLFDTRVRQLFVARDRAGEKPLFYRHDASGFHFASELKALMADPALGRLIDPEALDCYLAMGFIPGERTILRGVRKLPPAHALTFEAGSGRARVWRYWHLPEATATAELPGEHVLVNELEVLLADAVRRQLVADVPVGVLLSGGVDSSLVTAMAVRAAPHVKTFTVRFPSCGAFDETPHARLIARHFGTEHLELEAEEAAVDLLPTLARHFDEPLVDSSMIPTFLVSRLVRQHCTVALGGDGGDELFGGYPHYQRLLWLEQHLARVPRALRRATAAMGRLLPTGIRGRNWVSALGTDLGTELPFVDRLFEPAERRMLLGQPDWPLGAERRREERLPGTVDLLQRATRMDFENYLAEDILVKVDRASMANSLEVRAPLLDYRVIEFAFGRLASRHRATVDQRKVLLRRLCRRVLPPEFDERRKQGFSIPLDAWLARGQWRDTFRDTLGDSASIFDRRAALALLESHGPRRRQGERLFALVMFELWRREYGATL